MMENEINTPEENNEQDPIESGDWISEIKNWFQDNIRIVLSIVIVLAIALGVYSYSKRGAEVTEEFAMEEDQVVLDDLLNNQEETTPAEETGQEPVEQPDVQEEEAVTVEENQPEEVQEQPPVEEEQPPAEMPVKEEQPPVEESQPPMEEPETVQPPAEEESAETVAVNPTEPEPEQIEETQEAPSVEPPAQPQQPETVVSETNDVYEVTAATGDSLTTLARSAAKQYLDTYNDSGITAEHKIYIEDYLAKKMGYSSRVNVGETKSFSQQDIQEAVNAAKQLTPAQLENLKMYSQRVPNL